MHIEGFILLILWIILDSSKAAPIDREYPEVERAQTRQFEPLLVDFPKQINKIIKDVVNEGYNKINPTTTTEEPESISQYIALVEPSGLIQNSQVTLYQVYTLPPPQVVRIKSTPSPDYYEVENVKTTQVNENENLDHDQTTVRVIVEGDGETTVKASTETVPETTEAEDEDDDEEES